MGRDSDRGYASCISESNLQLGLSRPIESINMDLDAVRPPHHFSRGGGQGVGE